MNEVKEQIKQFNEERDWDQFHSPENLAKLEKTRKKYPVDKAKGKSTKYNKL